MTPISANFVEKCRMIKYFSMNAHALTGSNPSCFRKKQTDIHLFLSGSPKSVRFLGKRSSNGAHEKTGLKPVFDSSVVCCDVVRSKGSDRLLRLACRLPPRLPPGRLRTIRYSNVHRTFELRSCPHGFESLLFSYKIKKTPTRVSF